MKRRLEGEIKIIGYYAVAGGEYLYMLPFEAANVWEYRKNTEAIALCWQGKMCFRQLYVRSGKYYFKFFNRNIYLSEITRTEGTHAYITV
jgi:hypothetical protein